MSLLTSEPGFWSDFMERTLDSEDSDDDFVPSSTPAEHSSIDQDVDLEEEFGTETSSSMSDDEMDESDDPSSALSTLAVETSGLPVRHRQIARAAKEKELEELEEDFLQRCQDVDGTAANLDARVALLVQETGVLQKKLDLAMEDCDADLLEQMDYLHLKKDFLNAALRLFSGPTN